MSKSYVIANGKTLTSKKGIVGSGEPVEVKHFASQAIFDDLVKKGYIVEVAEEKPAKKSAKKAVEVAEEKPVSAEEKPEPDEIKEPTFTLAD